MLGHRALTMQDYVVILKTEMVDHCHSSDHLFRSLDMESTFLVRPQYVSQTLVLVEQQKVPDSYVKPVITEDLNGRLATMREQILSRSRLQPIIERFNLLANSNMSMDDRVEPDPQEHRHQADSIRSCANRRPAWFLHLLQGLRSPHGAVGVRRDYFAIC